MQVTTVSDFPRAPLPTALDDATIHVWFFAGWPAARHAAESEALRGLLARYVGTPAQQVRIVREALGKPHIAESALEFNLSHTASSALVAVANRMPLGVDLERVGRRRPVLALAQRFFAASEAAALATLDENRRQEAFLDLWCCKEAILKALGRGLGFGLDRVVFELDMDGNVQRLAGLHDSPTPEWHVVRLRPVGGFVAALAWRGPPRDVRVCLAPPLV